uniref:SbcC/MukB-like Walker B domain-containing protein n=1 Tax=Nocardioides sp. TaxID=35761 RepID=UPI002B26DB0E
PSYDEVMAVGASATEAVAVVRAALPKVERRRVAHTERVDLEGQIARLETEFEVARSEQAVLPARLESLRADLAGARAAADRLPTLAEAETLLSTRLEAHESVVGLRAELAQAREEWVGAREVTVGLKEELLVLQQARIDGMAAELAGALASGCSCPVCGSADHPAKASAAPGAPDARAEKDARAAVVDADLLEHAFSAKVHELETTMAASLARAGEHSAEHVRAQLSETRGLLRASTASAARADQLARALAAADAAALEVDARLHELSTSHARLLAAHERVVTEIDGLHAEIADVLESTGHPDLESLLAHHERTLALGRAAERHLEQAEAAEAARLEAEGAADQAAQDAAFADAEEAAAHALAPPEVEDLATRVEHHQRRLAAVRDILSEHGAGTLSDSPPPPVDDLETAHRAHLARRDAAAAGLHVATTRHERLTGLVADLDEILAEWMPLREDLLVAAGLAGFVEGKSADNALKMRLSAYVLSYRLTQVVAAANERLARMSDQRYSLEHTGTRGAGETRGGLSLLVRDDWSGETRDPATLSGGETFVVSLALALGLSDVVTHESGGAALDTLFVDEGFGSLDADTLDDVMDTIDSLRDGGRVVGLVSHVAEMRDRIPAQLVVSKARRGSTVTLRGC